MHESHIDAVNEYFPDVRKRANLFGMSAVGNHTLVEVSGMRLFSPVDNRNALARVPLLGKLSASVRVEPSDTRISLFGQDQGLRILDVSQGQTAITNFKNLDGLFTWELLSCTGIAAKLYDKKQARDPNEDRMFYFLLGHYKQGYEAEILDVAKETKGRFLFYDLIYRARENNNWSVLYRLHDLVSKYGWSDLLDNQEGRCTSQNGEGNAMLVSKEGVTIFREELVPPRLEIKQEIKWKDY